jgi:hypothetical protein
MEKIKLYLIQAVEKFRRQEKKYKLFIIWTIFILIIHSFFIDGSFTSGKIIFYYVTFIIFAAAVCLILYSFFKLLFVAGDEVAFVSLNYWLVSFVFVFVLTLFINIDVLSDFNLKKIGYVFYSFTEIVRLLLISLILFVILASFGKKVLSVLRVNTIYGRDCNLIALGIGVGILSYFTYLLCLVKLAYPQAIILFLIVLGAISYKEVAKYFHLFFENKLTIKINRKKFDLAFAYVLILVIFIILLVYSFANLLSGEWDTFHQYLTFPSAYAENHGFVYFKYHPHWGFPQNGEMIYLVGILLGGVKIPFVLNYCFVILSILVLHQIFGKFGSKNTIWTFLVSATIPFSLFWLAGYLKIESIFFFYVALIYLVLYYIFTKAENTKHFFIFSIFCGIAIAVKYTAVLLVFSLAAPLFFFRHKINLNYKKVLIFVIIVACLYAPWGIRNWFYYNNPLYPILSGDDFFSRDLGIQCNTYFLNHCKEDVFEAWGNDYLKFSIPMLSNILILLKYLILYSGMSINDPGPWFIIFLPLLVTTYFKIKEPFIRTVCYTSFIYLIFWMLFFSGQIWYLMPTFFGMLILFGYIFERHFDIGEKIFFKVSIIIWLFWVLFFWIINGNYSEKIAYFRNESNLEQSYDQIKKRNKDYDKADWLRMWGYINSSIISKNSSKVIYGFYDTQGYFLNNSYKNFIPDFYGYLFDCLSQDNLAYERMKKINVGYIVVDSQIYIELEDKKKEELLLHKTTAKFREFINKYGEIVHVENNVILYSLK